MYNEVTSPPVEHHAGTRWRPHISELKQMMHVLRCFEGLWLDNDVSYMVGVCLHLCCFKHAVVRTDYRKKHRYFMLTLYPFPNLSDDQLIDVFQVLELRWAGILASTQLRRCRQVYTIKYTFSDSCGVSMLPRWRHYNVYRIRFIPIKLRSTIMKSHQPVAYILRFVDFLPKLCVLGIGSEMQTINIVCLYLHIYHM